MEDVIRQKREWIARVIRDRATAQEVLILERVVIQICGDDRGEAAKVAALRGGGRAAGN